jgi:hypothetical protein
MMNGPEGRDRAQGGKFCRARMSPIPVASALSRTDTRFFGVGPRSKFVHGFCCTFLSGQNGSRFISAKRHAGHKEEMHHENHRA